MLCSNTCIIMDTLVLKMAQKVTSVDNINKRPFETLQPGGLCLTASRDD